MTEYVDQDFYDDLVQSFGPPQHVTYPTQEQLDYWEGRIPPSSCNTGRKKAGAR